MIWQDIVITMSIIAFSYALIPQVYQGFKNKKGPINLQTSGITLVGMVAISVAYFTLDLYFSAIMGLITGALWGMLLIQKLIYK